MGRRPATGGALTTDELSRGWAETSPETAAPGIEGPNGDVAGLYGPDSVAWRLNREATLLLGAGPRALLLQIAHPLVAEGVDQHSDFRADPWRRLEGTLRSYLAIVYGTTSRARAEIARLERLHRAVTGPVVDAEAARRFPGRYRARDPELSLWVHATLVDSTIVANREWIEPLRRADEARYYTETLPIGRAFGIPGDLLPPDLDAFEGYMAAMLAADGPVHPTPTARRLAGHILHPTLAPLFPRAASTLERLPRRLYDWVLWPAIGLLPASVRAEYGIEWGATRRVAAAWLVAGFRAWRPWLPVALRQMPRALAADRRIERAPAVPRGG